MITIKPSPTADTRTCDVSKVTREELLGASLQHIGDVGKAIAFLTGKLTEAASVHDYDKLTKIDHFFSDFKTGFKTHTWWDNHRKLHRHHLAQEDGVPEDVNLIDVLEMVADCVCAGMARSGDVYPIELSDELLQLALSNTVELLKGNMQVCCGDKAKCGDTCDAVSTGQ